MGDLGQNWSMMQKRHLEALSPRPADAHKGSSGRVVVLAGSGQYRGAALLAARAATRGGAGLVQVAVPQCLSSSFSSALPSVIVCPLRETATGRISTTAIHRVQELLSGAGALVAGPGLSVSRGLLDLMTRLLIMDRPPTVLDADALNLISLMNHPQALQPHDILTPHPAEAARLLGETTPIPEERRGDAALSISQKLGCVVVLKGHRTRIASGSELFENETGNPILATGGTGDVLAGLIGALLARGLKSLDAARLGVHVHGATADLLRDKRGEEGLLPSELADALPLALRLPGAGG